MSVEIKPVNDRHGLKMFIDYPHDLYRGVSNYVPQLFRQQQGLLDERHSPFLEHSSLQAFLAVEDGKVRGRIAAIENTIYNRTHGGQTGFFGFFDCCSDRKVAAALFGACATWLKGRGLKTMRGPVNPDMNNSCGILVGGFEELPSVFMPFNAAYYRELLKEAGFEECMGLNAWDIQSDRIPEVAFRYGDRVGARLEKGGYRLRPISKKGFDDDMRMLRVVYNDSLAASWGATPITVEEFEEQAAGMKVICPRDLIQIIEYEGRIVAFIGAVPNVHEIQKNVRRGRLWPFGLLKLLLGWRSIRGSRIVMYGVDPDHRGKGLAIWLYVTIIRKLRSRGFTSAEASYVLAENKPVNELSARLGGVCRKKYAIYEKRLEAGTGSGSTV
jgi:GNAT superfamily N-acetyltransferase